MTEFNRRVMRNGGGLGGPPRRAFTLLEVVLVVALLAIVAALALPNLTQELAGQQMSTSAEQMRSLLELIRANAQMDGKRFRIRMPRADELDRMGTDVQPVVERADDPMEPETWTLVEEPWTLGETFLRDCRCIQVRLGRPTVEKLRDPQPSLAEELANLREDFDVEFPPVTFEPDGTSPWAVFVVYKGPREKKAEELAEEDARIEVIMDGATGMIWLQRPLYESELSLFEENGWPVVLRRDFLDPRELTEDDVLELSESSISPGANGEAKQGG
ncbi:MAG: prepilin-type N-terminal cleavage/methylation domain-containing protein [Phycisphaerales bacterium]|nr:prepilin-type N-terminal cleavage/methylation domain-containing protein [Phycisphaerales bacterium]